MNRRDFKNKCDTLFFIIYLHTFIIITIWLEILPFSTNPILTANFLCVILKII